MYTWKKVWKHIPKYQLWLSFRGVAMENYFCFLIFFNLYKIYMLFIFNYELNNDLNLFSSLWHEQKPRKKKTGNKIYKKNVTLILFFIVKYTF